MPIRRNMSHRAIVQELIEKWRKTGLIGKTRPSTLEEALDIATAIAYKVRGVQRRDKRGGRGERRG
jgi:hypothetical protein